MKITACCHSVSAEKKDLKPLINAGLKPHLHQKKSDGHAIKNASASDSFFFVMHFRADQFRLFQTAILTDVAGMHRIYPILYFISRRHKIKQLFKDAINSLNPA